MIVIIDIDEKYPFYDVYKPEKHISDMTHKWLTFYDIPEEKYNWICSVYKQLDDIEKYLEQEVFQKLKVEIDE